MSETNDTWPIWLDSQQVAVSGRALLASVLVHLLAFIAVIGMDTIERRLKHAGPERRVTKLFIPRRTLDRRVPRITVSRPSVPLLIQREDDQEEPETVSPRVEMSSIELSFQDDTTNELPGVVTAFGAVFALAEKSDPSLARYLIEPPGWKVREVMQDTSGKLRLSLSPSSQWAVIRDAARENSINLSNYDVCALFDEPFGKCLRQAIQANAAAKYPDRPDARVQSARLAFAANQACGVEVLEVSLAPASLP